MSDRFSLLSKLLRSIAIILTPRGEGDFNVANIIRKVFILSLLAEQHG
jgi:hypothetical protein